MLEIYKTMIKLTFANKVNQLPLIFSMITENWLYSTVFDSEFFIHVYFFTDQKEKQIMQKKVNMGESWLVYDLI